MNKKYSWDLSYLYKTKNDFDKDLSLLESLYKQKVLLKGKLNNKANFIKYLDLSEKTTKISQRLSLYTYKYYLDTTNTESINTLQQLEILQTNYAPKLAWTTQEQLKLGLPKIKSFIKGTKYADYEFVYQNLFLNQKHIPSAATNKILSEVIKSRSAANEIYKAISISDYKDPVLNYKGKDIILTQKKYTEILEETDPVKDIELRKLAFLEFNKQYELKKHSYAQAYKSIIEGEVEDLTFDKHKSLLDSHLFPNQIPTNVYQSILKIGKDNSHLIKEYSDIKKKHLIKAGIKKPISTDAALKLYKVKSKFTIEQAIDIVKKVAKTISKEYYEATLKALENGRIDYLEDKNKYKGAFSSGAIIYDPLILMNFDNTLESVMTLAHEVGHSVHSILSNANQPMQYQSYSIYLAEIASFTLEQLVLEYIIENTKDKKEKLALTFEKVDFFMGSFFRQLQYSQYENSVIKIIENKEIVNFETLANLWEKSLKDFNSLNFTPVTENSKYYWARVPHFFDSPYYVYQYSTCVAASLAFIKQIKEGRVDNFINLLKAGSSKYPNSILLDNNIDLTNHKTYEPLFNEVKKLLDKLVL